MSDDAGPAARRELLARLRDTLKAMRLFKNQQPPRHLAVPGGTFGVLATIDDIEPSTGCHVKDLAAACALDPSTISRAVAALVRGGLVQRAADPADGRASVLALTPRGHETLDGVTGWYDDLLAGALSGWSSAELAAFGAMLQRFSHDLITRHTLMNNFDPTLEAAR
jgi:DNA-binding MarR family transcriptional regulator